MMASAFDEENTVLDPPPGVDPDDVSVLSVYRGAMPDGRPVVISCWKPTAEEWDEMRRTGRIWVVILGENMPPISPTGYYPFAGGS